MVKKNLLSDYIFEKKQFPNLDNLFKQFFSASFKKKNHEEKTNVVCKVLVNIIEKQKTPCFLLPHVLDFIHKINKKNIINNFHFSRFEHFLNQEANLSFDENLLLRGKIAGRYILREDYQTMFPISMGKIYEGPHFVTAHKSPDLDSTIASFWGWLDAFSARVAKGCHFWNIPKGPPQGQIEIEMIFNKILGENIFAHLAKKRSTLSLTSSDLMTQEGMIKKKTFEPTSLQERDRDFNAVVVVDDDGYYLGDWRTLDVEGVRNIIMLLNNCLRWFENNIYFSIVSLFTKKNLYAKDISSFSKKIFGLKIKDCDPVKEYTDKQKENLNNYLIKVLGVKKGLSTSFEELFLVLFGLSLEKYTNVNQFVDSIKRAHLFDPQKRLIENRPKIFKYIEKIVTALHSSLQQVRKYIERVEIALKIKTQVFKHSPKFLTFGSEVEEIKSKMEFYQYLTVAYPDNGKFIPVGIVKEKDLRSKFLATVSFRDFCNNEEINISSYLQVISVIDHHKSQLSTFSPPLAIISDAQSSNTLVAKLNMEINSNYSTSRMTCSSIKSQLSTEKNSYIYQSLLKKLNAANRKDNFYLHHEREFIEYLHYIYGILDDTDLLMKVSNLDVEIVAHLLNRMKSILMKKEMQIIDLSKLPRDRDFAKNASKVILKNEDMYSLYKKVYLNREKQIEESLKLCATGKYSTIFADSKIINSCAKVSQTKLFAKNVKTFQKI